MTAVPFRARIPEDSAAPGLLSSAWNRVKSVASAVVRPHKASLTRLTEMPLAVAGTGCVDFAAFHWHVLGWIVTGLSLWLIEHMIADDDDGRRM